MKPIGPLMREHRLIEDMVALLESELKRLGEENQEVNSLFIKSAIDFFRTYADRTHHGKEEDILFKALQRKNLVSEHQRIMDELVAEHIFARKTVSSLEGSITDYQKGSDDALGSIINSLKELIALYPKHIDKEDNHFFYPILDYFNNNEQDTMLQEFWEFDRQMIHEKYQKVVEGLKDV